MRGRNTPTPTCPGRFLTTRYRKWAFNDDQTIEIPSLFDPSPFLLQSLLKVKWSRHEYGKKILSGIVALELRGGVSTMTSLQRVMGVANKKTQPSFPSNARFARCQGCLTSLAHTVRGEGAASP